MLKSFLITIASLTVVTAMGVYATQGMRDCAKNNPPTALELHNREMAVERRAFTEKLHEAFRMAFIQLSGDDDTELTISFSNRDGFTYILVTRFRQKMNQLGFRRVNINVGDKSYFLDLSENESSFRK